MRHASLWAKYTMEKRGWVCINEYGAEAAEKVDLSFIRALEAVQLAKIDLQRWMAGWDSKRGTPIMGVWAPKLAAAIIGALSGTTASAASIARAFATAKVSPTFAVAVDAAWRMGGVTAARELIAAELPDLARDINATVK